MALIVVSLRNIIRSAKAAFFGESHGSRNSGALAQSEEIFRRGPKNEKWMQHRRAHAENNLRCPEPISNAAKVCAMINHFINK
jgi:hypothetical protein